ncbi:hypothetical protein GGR51DRAFT_360843 [Nemania sp. FL0031]|nr:hypothetical protein GGR51DRAFT_360843 [Nemania sp. FL0031]
MEMTHIAVSAIWRPSFLLKYTELRDRLDPPTIRAGPPLWDESPLNPKNRPLSLDTRMSGWRVDGATGCGTRFFVAPFGLLPRIPPLRIFVYLPDQGDYPPALRIYLDSAFSVPLRDGRAIARLGIAKHICRALDHWCAVDTHFLERYQRLPFGSQLVFENIAANVENMRLAVVPNRGLEAKSVSLCALQRLWANEVAREAWPPALDVMQLQLVRQLHDTISIVTVDRDTAFGGYPSDGGIIFKSVIDSYDHLYHELRFLLTAAPHDHIMPRPLAVVTKLSAFGGKRGVVGFLLRLFPSGSIRDILPLRQKAGTLDYPTKLHWCKQVTTALIHITEVCGTFFADLRPDNVLLDSSNGQDRLLLCDFEQRGNWHEWNAPEVRYRQYVENLRAAIGGATVDDARLVTLLKKYERSHPSSNAYSSAEMPVEAKNRAWFALSPTAQEKATVYTLGLFIYTVFEGLSNIQRNIANQWPHDPDIEFPEFKRTPPAIRELVSRCISNEDWETSECSTPFVQAERVIRKGKYLYPEGQTDIEQDTNGSAGVVLDAALTWWTREIIRAEEFTESPQWKSGLFGSSRPTLKGVMHTLELLSPDIPW